MAVVRVKEFENLTKDKILLDKFLELGVMMELDDVVLLNLDVPLCKSFGLHTSFV